MFNIRTGDSSVWFETKGIWTALSNSLNHAKGKWFFPARIYALTRQTGFTCFVRYPSFAFKTKLCHLASPVPLPVRSCSLCWSFPQLSWLPNSEFLFFLCGQSIVCSASHLYSSSWLPQSTTLTAAKHTQLFPPTSSRPKIPTDSVCISYVQG